MKKLTALVLVFTLIPAAGAAATTLEEILERSRDAVYSGEQLISCATPDGYRGVLTSIKQRGSSINITALTDTSSEVAIGPGVLVRRMGDAGVVEETKVGGGVVEVATLYEVEDLGGRFFIGREASAYRLTREGMLRGELVLDNETGALIRMTSFDNTGQPYCVRSFISFDPSEPDMPQWEVPSGDETNTLTRRDDLVDLPLEVAGFAAVDSYSDEAGFNLTYYSDGFFSFAIFQAPNRIDTPDGVNVDVGGFRYWRAFNPGQVTYAWEVRGQGMAMIGDLPPDLHQPVLEAMPRPADLGFLQRWWRNLFRHR